MAITPNTISGRNCTGPRCNDSTKRFSKRNARRVSGQSLLRTLWGFLTLGFPLGRIRLIGSRQTRPKRPREQRSSGSAFRQVGRLTGRVDLTVASGLASVTESPIAYRLRPHLPLQAMVLNSES